MMGQLTALQCLSLKYYQGKDLAPISKCTALRLLDLHGAQHVASIQPLTSLISLQHLNLSFCKGIADLSPLTVLNALRHLNLRYCNHEAVQFAMEMLPVSWPNLEMIGIDSGILPGKSSSSIPGFCKKRIQMTDFRYCWYHDDTESSTMTGRCTSWKAKCDFFLARNRHGT